MDAPLQVMPVFELTLTDAQYRAIGHMIAQWAFLESEINSEIRWLLGRSEHRRKSVNFQSRFQNRTTDWINLAKHTYGKRADLFKAAQQIAGQSIKIKRERDDIAHGRLLGSGMYQCIREGRLVSISDGLAQAPKIENLACRIAAINRRMLKHQIALEKSFRKRP